MKTLTKLKMTVMGLLAAFAITAAPSDRSSERHEQVSPLIVLGTSQVSQATYDTFLPVLMNDIIHSRDE
ncbi:Uncharacterised protein [Klebsiella variicola]|uniref:Uncharacterized protein n=1 Tax=Klebsiella variicola TaxID=244366 RepID=A0ABD7PED9_KLEVA|nr:MULTISPECIES: hypothetical protein [Enterobacteriaceae]SXF99583.1 Uncharacterised protein [Klebsiella variicola]